MHVHGHLCLGVLLLAVLAGCSEGTNARDPSPNPTPAVPGPSLSNEPASAKGIRFENGTAKVVSADGSVIRVIHPVIVHHYEASITCAIEADEPPISNAYHGSCDSSKLTQRAWQTEIDLTNDNLEVNESAVVRLRLEWGANAGEGQRFSFCFAKSETSYGCDRIDGPINGGTWEILGTIAMEQGAIWSEPGRYAAWIEFPACLPSPTCLTGFTIARDWNFKLTVYWYPGISLSFG